MTFLNPMLLAGLVLAAGPIIIHLLNRRRFHVVQWAPMRYLQLTLKTNRRRLKLEQWILLALRTLLVVLVILAVARPTFSSRNTFARWFAGRQRISRVLVLDNSMSMGARHQGVDAFTRARDTLAELIKSVGPQDSVTILLTSDPDHPLVDQAQLTDKTALLAAIGNLKLTDTADDWTGVFKQLDAQLARSVYPQRQVVLLTDRRAAGWSPDIRQAIGDWVGQRVSLRLIDVGQGPPMNLALLSLEPRRPVAWVHGPIEMKATWRNDTPEPTGPVRAMLTAGQMTQPISLPSLAPGQVATVPLSVVFDEPGDHAVTLALPDDALPGDNVRQVVLAVKPQLNVTLVDGEPSTQPFGSETDFLHAVWRVPPTPWHITRVTDPDALLDEFWQADLVVLANVAQVSPAVVERLTTRVVQGMGLMIFAGDQVDVAAYNHDLWRDGQGLLPLALDGLDDTPRQGLIAASLEDSPLGAVVELGPAVLAEAAVRRTLAVTGQADDVRVLARWNDDQASPAVVDKKLGHGRVMYWTVCADRQWGDWPTQPGYVLSMREAALALAGAGPGAGAGDAGLVQIAGRPLRAGLPMGAAVLRATVNLPDSDQPQPAEVIQDDADRPMLGLRETLRSGLYVFNWVDHNQAAHLRLAAVNSDPRESDTARLNDEQLQAWLSGLDLAMLTSAQVGDALQSDTREIWRTLALMVLAMFVIESLFAAWVDRKR